MASPSLVIAISLSGGSEKTRAEFEMARPAIDRQRRAQLDEAPLGERRGVAAEQQRLERLRRGVDQDGAGLGKNPRQLLAQLLAQLVVEIGQGLVEQHQLGALDDGAGDGGALLLAARDMLRQAVEQWLQAEQFGGAADAPVDLGRLELGYPQRRGDVLVDREPGVVHELLKHHRH